MRIIADLHTYTQYSHGRGSVLNNAAVAMARGLKAVGITDHGPRSGPWVGASLQALQSMRSEVISVDQRTVGLRVLAGAHCNIIAQNGRLDVPRAVRRELDLVLAGLHPGALPASGRDWLWLKGMNWAARASLGMRRRARVRNTEAVIAALYANEIDVLTDPGRRVEIDTIAVARACAQRGTAMEINASRETPIAHIRLAAEQGVRFVISSGANRPADVGAVARAVSSAIAAGLEPSQVINSDLGGLFEWLEARRVRRGGVRSGWSDWVEQLAPRWSVGGDERRQADWPRHNGGIH